MAEKNFMGKIITEVQTVAIDTLADQSAVKFTTLTLQEDFRILRSEINALFHSIDDTDNVAGLLFGIANNELSINEIENVIVAQGPLDRNDRGNAEEASRWVKILSGAVVQTIGSTVSAATVVQGHFPNETGGPMIISKDRWTYNDPEGWCFFLFNNTGSGMIGSGVGRLTAKHFGVWV